MSIFMRNLRKESFQLNIEVKQFIENRDGGFPEQWEAGLQEMLKRKALTTVTVGIVTFLNVYVSEQGFETQQYKDFKKSIAHSMRLIEKADAPIYRKAWLLAQRVMRLSQEFEVQEGELRDAH